MRAAIVVFGVAVITLFLTHRETVSADGITEIGKTGAGPATFLDTGGGTAVLVRGIGVITGLSGIDGAVAAGLGTFGGGAGAGITHIGQTGGAAIGIHRVLVITFFTFCRVHNPVSAILGTGVGSTGTGISGFECAKRGATISACCIGVITLLCSFQVSIAADSLAERGAADDTGPAFFRCTRGGTAVPVCCVAVIAEFRSFDCSIPAFLTNTLTQCIAVWTQPTTFQLADAGTAIAISGISVITGFRPFRFPISALLTD